MNNQSRENQGLLKQLGERPKQYHCIPATTEENSTGILLGSENRVRKKYWSFRRKIWYAMGFLFFLLILALSCFPASKLNVRLPSHQNKNAYDYIVVGGGPAGIIVATELAKTFKDLRILLLESGSKSQSSVLRQVGEDTPSTLFQESGLNLNKFDVPLMWSGVASSQERKKMLEAKDLISEHHWPIEKTLLGRGLGGSGLHNAMIYVRSLPEDFERWNSTLWTYEIILPHYQALEHYSDEHVPTQPFWSRNLSTSSWRGRNGPIRTTPSGLAVDPVAPRFVQAALASGEKLAVQGFNSPSSSDRLGVGYYEFNIHHGIRHSVAKALLGDASHHPSNLVVHAGISVRKVMVDVVGGKKRGVGVEAVNRKGRRVQYTLRDEYSEVILSCGAIMTPQILFNSGIGRNGTLVDLPGVGQNLQDHPVVAVKYSIDPAFTENVSSIYTVGDELEDYLMAAAVLEREDPTSGNLHSRLGTWGTPGFSAGGFLRSPFAKSGAPDVQLTVFPRQIEPHITGQLSRNRESYMRSNVMLVTVALLNADARYEVVASSSSIGVKNLSDSFSDLVGFELPSIQLPSGRTSYLSDRDIKVMEWAISRVRGIWKSGPLREYVGEEILPGEPVTGSVLQQHIRDSVTPNSHWVGTTKIGKEGDEYAVVNERLQVRGVDDLRVIDSGVIPEVPNGNTHSTVCVVARRGAELVAQHRSRRKTR